ncbi:hypothetical protein SS50377_22034 [Spironucleus salmonicida]|uniref:Uncharacterized protein n=1 Tax=Spironucleus salmonicida TaxID=348837 RepID=V6LQ10_9EUKA|nr:hypothetical protein SS50377_22034 [Spironucleus salmonicida]|eukprot:EST45801.1 Hypothetical protein SS50377_14375 [Spironucleus salmonicida]
MDQTLKRKIPLTVQQKQLIKTSESRPSRTFAILSKNQWKPLQKKFFQIQSDYKPLETKMDFIGRAPTRIQECRQVLSTNFHGQQEINENCESSKILFGEHETIQIQRGFSPSQSRMISRTYLKKIVSDVQSPISFDQKSSIFPFPLHQTSDELNKMIKIGICNASFQYQQQIFGKKLNENSNLTDVQTEIISIQKLQEDAELIAQQKIAYLSSQIERSEIQKITNIFYRAIIEQISVNDFFNQQISLGQSIFFDPKIQDINIRIVNYLQRLDFIQQIKIAFINNPQQNKQIYLLQLLCFVQQTNIQFSADFNQVQLNIQIDNFTPHISVILSTFIRLNPKYTVNILKSSIVFLKKQVQYLQSAEQQKHRIRQNYVDELLETSDEDIYDEFPNYIDTNLRGMLLQTTRQNNIAQLDHDTVIIAIQDKFMKGFVNQDRSLGQLFSNMDNSIYILFLIQQCIFCLVQSNCGLQLAKTQIPLLIGIMEELNEFIEEKTTLKFSAQFLFLLNQLILPPHQDYLFPDAVKYTPSSEGYINKLQFIFKQILKSE